MSNVWWQKRDRCCAVKDQGRKRERNTETDKERETQRKGDRQTVKKEQMTSTCSSDFIKDINNQEIASDRKKKRMREGQTH